MSKLLILFALLPAASLADDISGLVAKYSFNSGNAKNDIGPDHAKVVGAMPLEDRFGNPENAYYFQGVPESYLNLGTSPALKPPQGSISLWFKIENLVYSGKGTLSNPLILTKSHAGNDFYEGYAIGIELTSRKLGIASTESEALQVGMRSREEVVSGKWYHVVMAYDDDFLYLYLNGVFEGKIGKHFRTRFLAADSVMVGNTANTKNARFFNGYIDDIEIYNRVLTPNEVSELYNTPNPNRFHELLRSLLIVLLTFSCIILLVWLITKRYKKELRKEKEKNRLLRQMHEMEMQVFKAQMNPHFIFNAMSSVQEFILAGDNDNAHRYLGKFSRLLRKMLEGARDTAISLENEIDLLTKYIEIESLRFKQAFAYEISTDAQVAMDTILIPQMLIQPLVENAIWHGLLPKKDSGLLSIRFELLHNEALLCTVDDNGVGRKFFTAAVAGPLKKSMAIELICQRLQLMTQERGRDYHMSIIDKVDAMGNPCGTRVTIQMPILN